MAICVQACERTFYLHSSEKSYLHGLHFCVLSCVLQTCLSKGGGFHFPPCHMLNFCGFRILLDCPLDLYALMVFSPVPTALDCLPFEEINNTEANGFLDSRVGSRVGSGKRQKIEKLLDAKSLLFAEPWYKTVYNLHLWNASFIDVVLISSPMGILGLPFLTRMKDFSAKVVFRCCKLSLVCYYYLTMFSFLLIFVTKFVSLMFCSIA